MSLVFRGYKLDVVESWVKKENLFLQYISKYDNFIFRLLQGLQGERRAKHRQQAEAVRAHQAGGREREFR